MDQQTPLFLMRARDMAIYICIIVGLGLLFVYGSRAIATADDKQYVEGWKNRPFLTVPITEKRSTKTPVDAHLEVIAPAPVSRSSQTVPATPVKTGSASNSTQSTTSANKTTNVRTPKSNSGSQTNKNTRNRPSLQLNLDRSLGQLLHGLGL